MSSECPTPDRFFPEKSPEDPGVRQFVERSDFSWPFNDIPKPTVYQRSCCCPNGPFDLSTATVSIAFKDWINRSEKNTPIYDRDLCCPVPQIPGCIKVNSSTSITTNAASYLDGSALPLGPSDLYSAYALKIKQNRFSTDGVLEYPDIAGGAYLLSWNSFLIPSDHPTLIPQEYQIKWFYAIDSFASNIQVDGVDGLVTATKYFELHAIGDVGPRLGDDQIFNDTYSYFDPFDSSQVRGDYEVDYNFNYASFLELGLEEYDSNQGKESFPGLISGQEYFSTRTSDFSLIKMFTVRFKYLLNGGIKYTPWSQAVGIDNSNGRNVFFDRIID